MPLDSRDLALIRQEINRSLDTVKGLIKAETADLPQYLRVDGGRPGGKQAAFAIGAVFVSVVNTNPKELLGYGAWKALGAGKTLIGYDPNDTDFNDLEKTGGAKTHTLATPEMPSHTHTLSLGGGQVIWDYVTQFQAGANRNGITGGSLNGIQPTGGGGAHNNLSPYIVVYMWKRTA